MPITCPHCSREFPGESLNSRHLAKCNPASSTGVAPCLCGHESTSLTQMKRHRQVCDVWKSRDGEAVKRGRVRATSLARYGVENASHAPAVATRRQATVRMKYGVDNLFQAEEIKARSRATMLDHYGAEHPNHVSELNEKRKATCLARHGAENPFASESVKEKIRETMVERHGAENPQQVPKIRARTKATNEERYGGELRGSPVLAEKVRTTNLERYGDAFPQRTGVVKARQQETNIERWGVPWTGMNPEVRRRQIETHHERYGSHWFASEEGKSQVKEAMVALYGVDNPTKMEGWWERVVATFQERYGVGHPLQLVEFLEKRIETNLGTYGVPHPLQNAEVKGRMIATKIAKYGSPWGPSAVDGPNGLEQNLLALAPPGSLLFTGDGKFWRWLPKLKHHKNPDFIVPGPDPEHPKRGVRKVVEAFGDFWHSRMFTGRVPFEHESEVITAYADVGIECLIVWESEVKGDPDGVRARLVSFLGQGLAEADDGRGDVLDLFG